MFGNVVIRCLSCFYILLDKNPDTFIAICCRITLFKLSTSQMNMLENWTINFKKNCHNWLPFLAWFYSNHKVASHWPEWKERQRSAEERTEDTEACWWPKISIQTYAWRRGGTGSNLKNTRQRRREDYHKKLQKFHISRLTTRFRDNIRTDERESEVFCKSLFNTFHFYWPIWHEYR